MCIVGVARDLAAAAKIFAQSVLRFARKWSLKVFLFCFSLGRPIEKRRSTDRSGQSAHSGTYSC